jgi:hypothetical protein
MPAILFGPVYGAITYGLFDLLGYLLRPMGAYLPLMTVIVALGGFIRGALWLALRGGNNAKMRLCVGLVTGLLLLAGAANILALRNDGVDRFFYDKYAVESIGEDGSIIRRVDADGIDTEGMSAVSRLVVTRTVNTSNPFNNLAMYIVFMTAGLLGSSLFGGFLLLADWALGKYFVRDGQQRRIMPLFLSMVTGAVIVTTLNTILMRETLFAESWKLLPFTVVWIPRLVETVLSNTLYVYFAAMLLGLFEKQRNLRGWVK